MPIKEIEMNDEQHEELVRKVDGLARVQMLTSLGNILMSVMVTAIFFLTIWSMI